MKNKIKFKNIHSSIVKSWTFQNMNADLFLKSNDNLFMRRKFLMLVEYILNKANGEHIKCHH
jgi:hypothetical protein